MSLRRFICVLLVSLLCHALWAQRKAVFIIVDGIPADVIEKTPTPVLDEIAATGGYTRAYLGGEKDGYSQSPTISAVGYNHLLTGTWSNKHNVWDNDIAAPNYHYWNIFRIVHAVDPSRKTAVFSTWTDNRTKLIGEGLEAAGSVKLDYHFDGFELDTVRFPHDKKRDYIFRIDEKVSAEAGRYIAAKGPDLSWVYLEFTDDMGHLFGDSPQQADAVKKADKQIGRIWEAVKQRQRNHREEWMIVITTDHGRDAKTGKNHGGQSDRERTVWMVTNVNETNKRFDEIPATVDIAPSILRFIGVDPPHDIAEEMDGVPFIGSVSMSDLKARRDGTIIRLSWKVLDPKGDATIRISTTNDFKSGGKDTYRSVGTVPVAAGRYEIQVGNTAPSFCKIVVDAPDNMLNVWCPVP